MKQGQIVAVTNIINRFMEDTDMPSDISYAFFRLRNLLKEPIEFQTENQQKILNKHKGTVDSDGQLIFENEEDEIAFKKEMIDEANTDITLQPFEKIPFRNDGRCKLSMFDLIVLEDFFDYK